MRILAGFGLGLCGLAIVTAPMAKAQDAPALAADGAMPPAAQVSGHHHKGLFGWRHCVECQRAWAKKHDGVDVPPPPSMMPGGVVPGQVVHQHAAGGHCAACEGGPVVMESYAPGHAVVGGPAMAGGYAPGYAVVGGAPSWGDGEPAPVGVARVGQSQWNGPRMASSATRPGPGSYDPSVLPTSTIPAQTALATPGSSRPHIITHMLGLHTLHRPLHDKKLEQAREQHASIAYDPPAKPVNELPASVVYGKGR
jgi:hypothetical protein